MDKEEIRLAIDELMEQAGMGRRYRVQRLKACVDHPDPNVTLKALDQSWKLDGSYAPEKLDVLTPSLNVIALLDARQNDLRKTLELLSCVIRSNPPCQNG